MDEKGQELENPYEPMGLYGLGNYRTVDIRVSKALGIPIAH